MTRSLGFLAAILVGACARDAPSDGARAMDRAAVEEERVQDDRKEQRMRMVADQIEARGVSDPRVLGAMRRVRRHRFVPLIQRAFAYEDRPLPIGSGQTISQPLIVAMMTEALELGPESKVLEIGTGSGYQAAVLAEITPHVFTIEIVDELARRARKALEAEGYDTVHCRAGDGYAGWPEEAPFDAIVVTAAPPAIPPALIEQLAPGGRLCVPVGPASLGQELLLITKADDGTTDTKRLTAVRFVPMTGEAQRDR